MNCISTDLKENFSTKGTRKVAKGILDVTDDLREYWPLTIRQIFYQLVSKLIIPNNKSEYQRTSRIGVQLREEGLLQWSAVADNTRRTTGKRGMENVSEYMSNELSSLFNPKYYGRCYVQNQPVYCELSTEKDALASIIEDSCYGFCTRLNVVRGQCSATLLEQIAGRMDKAIMKGQQPIILHFGDLDPSGIAIPKAMQRNLSDRHGVDVEIRQIALTVEQVITHSLPLALDALKPNDPNFGAWLAEHGPEQAPVELDSLRPNVIQDIVREALEGVYDMSKFNDEMTKEIDEKKILRDVRNATKRFLFESYPEYFSVNP